MLKGFRYSLIQHIKAAKIGHFSKYRSIITSLKYHFLIFQQHICIICIFLTLNVCLIHISTLNV